MERKTFLVGLFFLSTLIFGEEIFLKENRFFTKDKNNQEILYSGKERIDKKDFYDERVYKDGILIEEKLYDSKGNLLEHKINDDKISTYIKNGKKEIWINYNEQGIPQTKEIITPYHDFEIDPNPSIYQKGVYSSTYYFDSETGRAIRDENGDEISVNGRPALEKQEGIFEDYYDNGQLASVGAYKNGQPLGFFAEYQEDGTPIYEKTYARLDTEKSIWDKFTQEKIEQTLYEGKYKIYSPNGDILIELSYKNGYLDGIQKRYFWNSKQLMYKGTYKNGKKVGTHIYYTTDGKIEKTDTY